MLDKYDNLPYEAVKWMDQCETTFLGAYSLHLNAGGWDDLECKDDTVGMACLPTNA